MRATAVALTALAAAATGFAAVQAPSVTRSLAAIGALAMVVAALCLGRKRPVGLLVVDTRGPVRLRAGELDLPLTLRYVGARFVSFGSARGTVAVWPDAVDGDLWRRLLVACRWSRPASTADIKGEGRGEN